MRTFQQAAWLAGILRQPVPYDGGQVAGGVFFQTRIQITDDVLAHGKRLGVNDDDMNAVLKRRSKEN